MSPGNVEVVRRAYDDFFARGELPFELCHPEIVVENVAESPLPGPFRGHDGLRQWWRELSAWGIRLELEEVVDARDDWVVAVVRFTGETPSGFDLGVFPWAAVHWLQDGLVARVRGFMNKEDALASLGARP